MTDEHSLLTVVHQNRNDDTPRLIFADWLEERGDFDRAELIRVQCQLARLPEDDASRAELQGREHGLLTLHKKTWLRGVRGLRRSFAWEFRRGFATRVTCPASLFLKSIQRIFRRAPLLEEARLTSLQHCELTQLDALPLLSRLRSLSQSIVQLNDAAAGIVTALSRLATRVTTLEQGGYTNNAPTLTASGMESLAACPYLSQLSQLSLYSLPIGPNGASALATSRYLTGLSTLNLGFTELGDRGVIALASASQLNHLRELFLYGNGITTAGVRAIASSPMFSGLVDLTLGNNAIDDDGAIALATSPFLGRLRRLHLGSHHFGRAAIRALSERFGDRLEGIRENR